MSYPNKTNRIHALVLSAMDYKERDQIVKVLTNEKILSVYAKGVQPLKSKNRRLCQPLSKVELNVTDEKNGMVSLVNGSVLASYEKIQDNLASSALSFLLRDLIFHSVFFEDLPFLLEEAWKELAQGSELNTSMFLIKRILEENGIAPYTDGCVKCGSVSRIETLSLQDGGFLCANCLHGRKKISRDKLRAYRLLMHSKKENLPILKEQTDFESSDIIFLARWFEKYYQLDLPSLKFYETAANM